MSQTYNIHEAKTHLSELLERVRRGDKVYITKAGTTIAQIIPASSGLEGPRELGIGVGEGTVPDDFNAPDPELERIISEAPIAPQRQRRAHRKPGA
jgi:prevent-host-death family protein